MRPIASVFTRVGAMVAGSAVIGAALAANPATANGVQSILRPFGLTTCNSSSFCLAYQNNGSGGAIKGIATKGVGVLGSSSTGPGMTASSFSSLGLQGVSTQNTGVKGTTQNVSSRTGTSQAGVYGLDGSTDGGWLNSGVKGFSTNGTGVLGVTQGSGGDQTGGIVGLSQNSDPASGAPGVLGSSVIGPAVEGLSTRGDGVYGFTSSTVAGLAAVSGEATNIVAVQAFNDAGNSQPALTAYAGTTDPTTNSFVTYDGAFNPTFWVDNGGNAHVSGLIYTSGPCSTGCARKNNAPQKVVQRYVPQESLPTMEDFGTGQLQKGAGYVRIDAAFSSVIDSQANYLVFVTPEGPTHGLYITNKTSAGFSVVENPGGHSTVTFEYRIVAKPYGVAARRLPTLASSVLPASHAPNHRAGALRRPRQF